ncbi:Dipeptide-binding ABC transporter, periplasmic substrate-binding component [Bacillus sp. ZZV12-4809]|nr:Dipeptide-binding ABC transporter, periplasmic substrate-binding component [Bacillus sp. ZZV12-4809]
MRINKVLITFLLIITMLLAACTQGTNVDSNSSSSQDSRSDANSQGPLVIGFEADATTLLANHDVNYTTDTLIRNIYDPLIDRDPQTAEFVPVLAEKWKNIDEKTWYLKLKEGIKFHNGADFNANAVKFSIDYILDESNGSFYRSRWANVKEVVVLSDYEVEIHTSVPFPSLIQRIAEDLLIMEPGYVEEVGIEKASSEPVGTGAYTFVEWSRDNHLKLKAFEDYWQGEPKIEEVEFRIIPEFSARMSAFMSGEIHLFKNIPVDSVKQFESNEVKQISSSRINYLALSNLVDGPLKDVKVRQAINHAINANELLETVLSGYGTRITGPLSQLNADHAETKEYDYDPDLAVKLIKEAGYSPEELKLTLDTPSGRYPMDSHIAQAIASQLQSIGINVEVRVNEWGQHLEKIQKRETGDMYILGWGPAFDAQSTIENLFTLEAPYSSFYQEDIEKKIKETNQLFDQEARYAGYAELQQQLVDQAAWVPLWQQADLYAVKSSLNFSPRVDEKMNVFEMSWN